MEATKHRVHLGSSVLDDTRHVCAFFHTRDEEYRVLLPFIQEGFAYGDRAVHIMGPEEINTHLRRLQQAGVNTDEAQQRGQLEVRPWQEIHLREGRFDQNAMVALIQEILAGGKTRGYPLTRFIANMAWASEDAPGVDDIVEYETRLNRVLSNYRDDAVIWTYDLAKFGASVVIDILRTHPLVIIGGILQVNPFYVPPDDFMQELKRRRVTGTSA